MTKFYIQYHNHFLSLSLDNKILDIIKVHIFNKEFIIILIIEVVTEEIFRAKIMGINIIKNQNIIIINKVINLVIVIIKVDIEEEFKRVTIYLTAGTVIITINLIIIIIRIINSTTKDLILILELIISITKGESSFNLIHISNEKNI